MILFFIFLLSIFFLGYSYSETNEAITSIKNINTTTGTNSIMPIDEDFVFNDTIKNALSAFNSNNYENAIIWYNKAIAIKPLSIEAINGKGLSLSESGKHQEAIELYDRALKIDPNSKQVLNNKGYSLDEVGKHQEAIELYDRALKIDPNSKQVLNNKGYSLYLQGKYQSSYRTL